MTVPVPDAATTAAVDASVQGHGGDASPTPAYDTMAERLRRIDRLEHVAAIGSWDQSALMPAGGAQARADALAELAGVIHGLRTDAGLGAAIDAAAAEPLTPAQQANVREARREHRADTALPESLVRRRALLTAQCEHAWRQQRRDGDWAGHARHLEPVYAVVREEAEHLSQRLGMAPYDALLDRHEPGLSEAQVQAWFAPLARWLPPLIARVVEHQRRQPPPLAPVGPFDVALQHALCEQVMRDLGFDFGGGRLDTSAHPFCGGVPQDVRLTTRYAVDDVVRGLMGTIHETGHARYEQGLPRAGLGQPVARARSSAIHESQSLSFEMQLARRDSFCRRLAPRLARAFGAQPAFEADNLRRWLTRVQPGYIRVDADEVTYPAHVVMRFEMERELVAGTLAVRDIPGRWDELSRRWLGIATLDRPADGPMQDVHWSLGLVGYFPTYTLGAMYAAQWFDAIERAHPDLDARIADGDLSPVVDWLATHVWSAASRWETAELTERATGHALDPDHLRRHLERRYLPGA